MKPLSFYNSHPAKAPKGPLFSWFSLLLSVPSLARASPLPLAILLMSAPPSYLPPSLSLFLSSPSPFPFFSLSLPSPLLPSPSFLLTHTQCCLWYSKQLDQNIKQQLHELTTKKEPLRKKVRKHNWVVSFSVLPYAML